LTALASFVPFREKSMVKVSIVNIPTGSCLRSRSRRCFYFKSKITIPLVVAGAGLAGFAMSLVNL
jgi:chromate transporter